MKNFLSIVWYRILPAEYGGQKGIACFNEELGKKHALTCLCSQNNLPTPGLPYKVYNQLPVSRFQFWKKSVRQQILAFIRERNFSDIIIEHPWHGWLGRYKKELKFRFIVHAHNIEFLRMKTRGKPWWRFLKKTEGAAFAHADLILFKTTTDRQMAIDIFNVDPAKCLVVPYGISEKAAPASSPGLQEHIRKRHDIPVGEKIILFAGTLDYEPNAAALRVIVDRLLPMLREKGFRCHIIVCGALSNKTEILRLNKLPGLTLAGFVPILHEYMQAADVFINPVTAGSGIQTKNLEALAQGCTIVSTAFAATGLPEYMAEKVLVSPDHDWSQFAANIIRAAAVKQSPPQRFYDEYNWEAVVTRFLHQAGQ